jgi:hypothetical protein
MDAQKLKQLESTINELVMNLNQVGSAASELQELLGIIHRPGWTTLAEGLLVQGIAENMLLHTKTLMSLRHTLLTGSRSVGPAASR